jgi:type IV pilus assembly protein PilM
MTIGLSSKKLLAIDWDRDSLRLVLVRARADGIDLLKAVSVPIPSGVAVDDAESLGAFVREAIRQGRIGARRALLNIPRDQVVLNTLNVPASQPEELPSIVQFQIVKELPFAVEQATIDFAVCGRFDPKDPSTILVAAVRNEQLAFYRKVAHEAGLTVERVGLRPYANLIAILTNAPELEKKTLLVVDVGPQLTEIDIIRDGALAFSRAASFALPELSGPSPGRLTAGGLEAILPEVSEPDETSRQAVSDLMVEVIRSFEAYRATEPGVSVDQIVVCGSTGLEPQLVGSLAARFAAQAGLYSPDRALSVTPQRAKELRGFSAAVGLALGHGGKGLSHFDFLSPKKPVSRRTMRLKKAPVAALAAVFFIAAGVTVHYRFTKPLKDACEPLAAEINAKREDEKAIRGFKKQVEALEAWQKSEQYWPELLVALTEVFPPERQAYVTRLDFETRRPKKKSSLRPSTMRVKLRTAALGQVNELSTKLRDLGLAEVRTGKEIPIGRRNDRGVAIYHFDTSIEAGLPLRDRDRVLDRTEDADRMDVEELPDSEIGQNTEIERESTDGDDTAVTPSAGSRPATPPSGASPGAADGAAQRRGDAP